MTTKQMDDLDRERSICVTCGNTAGWHRINNPRHRFSSVNGPDALTVDDGADDAAQAKSGGHVVPVTMPFDPALRMALMDAGVITVEMLDAADAKIKHLTRGVEANDG